MRMLFFAGALAAFPLQTLAQEADIVGKLPGGRANFPFARFAQKGERKSGTLLLPGAAEVWREDGAREAREEKNYWAIIRRMDAALLGANNQAQMARDLQAARAKAAAGSVIVSGGKPRKSSIAGPAGEQQTTPARPADPSPAAEAPTPALAVTNATPTSVGETVQRAANRIAETIGDTFYPQRTTVGPQSTAVILALVAIFLLPGIAGVLMFLAFLSLRGGHRLQSAVFAASGVALATLVYAAVFHQKSQSGAEKLRAECARLAITVTASVQELAPDGAVLADLRAAGGGTAVTDRNGCAFLYTAKPDVLPDGQAFSCVVYPAGSKETRNVFGLATEMPAYTDSLDEAVAHRRRQIIEGSWWHKLLRPPAES